MNILRHSKHKLLGGAAVCLTGLLTASLAFAGGSHSGSGKGKDRDRDRDKSDLRIKDIEFHHNKDDSLTFKGTIVGLDRKGSGGSCGGGKGSGCDSGGSCGGGGKGGGCDSGGSCGGGGKGSSCDRGKGQGHGKGQTKGKVWLSAKAKVELRCVNTKGQGKGKGGKRVTEFAWVEGHDTFDHKDIRRGEVDIKVTTDRPSKFHYKNVCPPNHEAKIESVRYVTANIEVQHGRDDAEVDCDFDPATKRGWVPRKHVTCYGDC
jgi:hypothetical protein